MANPKIGDEIPSRINLGDKTNLIFYFFFKFLISFQVSTKVKLARLKFLDTIFQLYWVSTKHNPPIKY